MKIDKFQIKQGSKLKIKDHKTDETASYNKEKAAKDLQANVERLAQLQDTLYAEDKHSLLVVFQAMDAAGKDGAVSHVFSGVNPQGCHVVSFKQPSNEELQHDFLWRCAKNLPERGKIGIFNRSHYEEVLVVRVHPTILQSQPLPDKVKNDKNIWKNRFKSIRAFEDNLVENGTHILKFFLNVSKTEQKERFLERIDTPEKNWKFSMGDVKERGYWDDYMHAYEDAISETSTENAPWFVIPADKKWFARLAISEIIVKKLESLKLEYPTLSEEHKLELADARKQLEAE